MKITPEEIALGQKLKQEGILAQKSIVAMSKMTFDDICLPVANNYKAILRSKVAKWQTNQSLIVNKIAAMMPVIIEMFPKDENGLVVGSYETYQEVIKESDDYELPHEFTDKFILVMFGNDDLEAFFSFNLETSEIYKWCCIGSEWAFVYNTSFENKGYINYQVEGIVKGVMSWNNKKGF